jgi:glutathione S-transferase
MTLVYTGVKVELRDILLKNKPTTMIASSPKATVPVLVTPRGKVIDESFDIMLWALDQNDPENWLPDDENLRNLIFDLVAENDGSFKTSLDKYKYFVRHPDSPREEYRTQGEGYLQKLEKLLSRHLFLMSDKICFADIAIFPFIRQFANSDRKWFDDAPYPNLIRWLRRLEDSDEFHYVMRKNSIWEEGTFGLPFPTFDGQ